MDEIFLKTKFITKPYTRFVNTFLEKNYLSDFSKMGKFRLNDSLHFWIFCGISKFSSKENRSFCV